MRYNFSSDFVKVIPPNTSFADAWETICFTLIKAECLETDIFRLKAPDCGIDIWRPSSFIAYQCKSNENGWRGSIDANKITKSLASALKVRPTYQWNKYCLALNAELTGNGVQKLTEYVKNHGIVLEKLTYDYWSELAEKHLATINEYLDYRFLMSEEEVKRAFEVARYYDNYISQFMDSIRKGSVKVSLSNNRTPVEFEIPFSYDLTIENLVDVAKSVFNINMEKTDIPEYQTAFRPSISLLYNGEPQSFNKHISEIVQNNNYNFELWIKIIWNDYREDSSDKTSQSSTIQHTLSHNTLNWDYQKADHVNRYVNRGELTIKIAEKALQEEIWNSSFIVKRLR